MEEPLELNTHPFILRIWREQQRIGSKQAIWRGRIIHVASGNERAVHMLEDTIDFIEPYLR